MKKILLATTVLAATAGFAMADEAASGVAVSGSARMGIVSTNGGDALFSSRVRIQFTATGTTDGGLEFGAKVRNDKMGQGNTSNDDSTVYISGAFGKLTMGDVSGAADALVGEVSSVGYTGLGSMNEIGFLGNGKTAALYQYSAGALSFAAGIGQTGSNDYSVAAKYSTDAYAVALGYEDNGVQTRTSLLGSATFSGATVKAKYATDSAIADDAFALSVDYAMSGANVTAFYKDAGTAVYGLGAAYDLGGGASVKGGVVKAEGSKASFDLGVTMSF